LKVVALFLFLQPGDTLKLGINDKRVSLRACKNGTILSGDTIGGEFLIVPPGDLGLISKDIERVSVWAHWDLKLLEEVKESHIGDHITELLVEGSNIRNESGS